MANLPAWAYGDRKNEASRALARAEDEKERANKKALSIKLKAEEMTGHVIQSAEVAGAGFAMGLIGGRYGGVDIVGVPVELALGVALNVAGHAKVAGKSSQHLHALGDGCLAAYFVALGRGVGLQMTREAGAVPAAPPAP